jgi:hypothetical protein
VPLWDAHGVDPEERLVIEHQPKFVYLIPTFGNPSGALLSLSAAESAGHGGQAQHTGRRRPYGDLYRRDAPPLSLLALSADVPGS